MSFVQRVQQALKFKSPDVEELIDMYWHRRLAAVATAMIFDTGVRPDQITWTSLAIGWCATGAYATTIFTDVVPEKIGYPLAAGLVFASVILDCMDGQLARAKGGGTRMGRILDGVVDAFVMGPFYVIMAVDITMRHGWPCFALTSVAGISTFMRTTVYDRVKAFYLANTQPSAQADGVETMAEVLAEYEEIKKTGTSLEKFLMWMYVEGQLKYGRMFSGRTEDAIAENVTPESIAAYRRRFKSSMRVMTFMGLGTHMIFIYCAVALMPWWPWSTVAIQGLFAFVGIPILVFAIVRAKAMATPSL